jgi:hypothetical protein
MNRVYYIISYDDISLILTIYFFFKFLLCIYNLMYNLSCRYYHYLNKLNINYVQNSEAELILVKFICQTVFVLFY